MNIYEKLCKVQIELKAPKNQYNSFGKYKYRSLEDISEGAKPLLCEYGLTLVVGDEPVLIGERTYIKATATLTDNEKPEDKIINIAFARESLTKKGMDDSQITGSTSSYARKYCLNGLFCIDDTKDADSMNNSEMPPVNKLKQTPTNNDNSFLSQMKSYAMKNNAAYKKVLDKWQISSATVIKDTEAQAGILEEIKNEIAA